MMRYFKNVYDGFVVCFGTGMGDIEITREEFDALQAVVSARPTDPAGKEYRLADETFEWVLFDAPVVISEEHVETDDSLSDVEDAICELAEMIAAQDDAIVELAEMIGGAE